MTPSPNPQSTNPPSISHRLSIQFLPRPPTEPTDTLVLNSGGTTNFFTDFRPLREDPSKCEWAFAGVKRYLDDGRCQWDHLVDNRAVESGIEMLPDIGRCETMEDGSEVERGTMLNPETGKVEEYVEVWKDEGVPSGSRVLVLQLRREDSSQDEDPETRGIFMVVGHWAQVVVWGKSGVSAKRWLFSDRWEECKSYGDKSQAVPCPKGNAADNMVHVPEGEIIEGRRWIWKIAEN